MQGPGSLPRASPENTKTTQQPLLGPALRTKRQQAAGGLSNKVQDLSTSMPIAAFPHPQVQHAGKELSPRSEKQIPWSNPGACPLLGDSAANQAGHAWHWPP